MLCELACVRPYSVAISTHYFTLGNFSLQLSHRIHVPAHIRNVVLFVICNMVKVHNVVWILHSTVQTRYVVFQTVDILVIPLPNFLVEYCSLVLIRKVVPAICFRACHDLIIHDD